MRLNEEFLEEFKELVTDPEYDAIKYWSKRINPKVENMQEVKEAVLLCIASHGDEFGDRGRIHVLLDGEPGTGKSMFRTWIAYQLGAETCDEASKVGLKGDARGEEITPGALPRANGGIITIDELDKFQSKDRKALLTAMEEGVINIEKGGMSAKFDAECRVIACCNTSDKFSKELVDRFDFHFQLDKPDKDRQQKIMSKIVNGWFREKDGYDGRKLKQYLNWIEGFKPDITHKTREQVDNLMNMYINMVEDKEERVTLDEGVHLDVGNRGTRQYQSLLRISLTIAKLNRRELKSTDFLRAIFMVDPPMKQKFQKMINNGFGNDEFEEIVNKVVE